MLVLVIGELQQLLASEAPGRVGGVIGCRPHLPRQIEHVGRQPHIQKISLIDLACGGPGRGFVEDGVEPVEVLNEDWNRNGVWKQARNALSRMISEPITLS
jgi:hypothetical protein